MRLRNGEQLGPQLEDWRENEPSDDKQWESSFLSKVHPQCMDAEPLEVERGTNGGRRR
jgi:hypothetical protein